MQSQWTFADAEFQAKRKLTRRDRCLAAMEPVVPWAPLLGMLVPHYDPNAGRGGGRPPIGLERMLRMYFLQPWYGLADEAREDAIYDGQAFRSFLGIDVGRAGVPDATTLLGFGRLREEQELTKRLLATINADLRGRGLILEKGPLVDASLFAAPSSTKTKDKARDPERHQTRTGQEGYVGATAHIGGDADSGGVHSGTGTAANVADVTETTRRLHAQEDEVYVDAGYPGAAKREEAADLDVTWYIAGTRSTVAKREEGPLKDLTTRAEQLKAKIRARVEHPLHIVKDRFHQRKLRSKGLAKNLAQFEVLCALANLVIVKKALLA